MGPTIFGGMVLQTRVPQLFVVVTVQLILIDNRLQITILIINEAHNPNFYNQSEHNFNNIINTKI